MGNLNPISYSFNNNNYAIFDIIPEYDPCVVTASAYPSTAGTIEGIGEYHIGVQCTLTAVPAENYEFRYWKHDDRIISYEQSYSFEANNDVDYMVAYFVSKPLKEIWAFHAPDTNDINSPYINLSWSYDDNHNCIIKFITILKNSGYLQFSVIKCKHRTISICVVEYLVILIEPL